ncbi:hypothetical protein JX265_002482 [Neoarthrinium moseri]|uniref:Cytochrome P450 n=1 Tax=Neoarthrinium moseri TaxID=1658444 RepID=A0A9P9WUH9_9PEZI|nr:hypothetical protein JX265_002482 [Neoarthrinium moseri]
MRYGPNRLIFNSAAALRDIHQNPKVTKSRLYLFSLNDGVPFIFNSLDRIVHLRKRKIIGPALSERSMRLFEPTLAEQMDIFLKQLLAAHSSPINLTERCRRLAMDVVGHLAFGFPLDLQTKDEHYYVLSGFSIANFRINSYMNFPFLSKLGLDHLFNRSPFRRKLRSVVQKMITTRLAQDRKETPDFYSIVMDNLETKSVNFQRSELFTESLFFISAGGDTVSTAMASLFFYLSRNKHCYNKLSNEIRTTFKSGNEIRSGPQLARCGYLRACIDETLRMSPPIGGTLWREQSNQEDGEPFVVDGHVIPRGTHVGVNIYSIHHNEKYFPEPFTFKPERWLNRDGKQVAPEAAVVVPSDAQTAFTPFSVGARSCVGKPMAYLESSLLVAKTLWYFDFEKCRGSRSEIGSGKEGARGGRGRVSEFQLYDVITSRHDGPYLTFVPRGDYCEELQ